MKALESLKAMASPKVPAVPSPLEDAEAADPAREAALSKADDLIAALKTGDREAVADFIESLDGLPDAESAEGF